MSTARPPRLSTARPPRLNTARPLYVDHTAKLGGAELSLLDLATHRPGAGVALFEDGPLVGRLRERGVPTHVLDSGGIDRVRRDGGWGSGIAAGRAMLKAARQLAQLGRETGAEVLYANSLKGMLVSVLAGRRMGKDVVWHLRDMLTGDHFSAMNRRVCVFASNRGVARVIANSHATAAAYRAAGGRAPVSVVYNGIDAAAFDAARPASDASVDGRAVVGLFARLSPWKGQHILIEALPKLPNVEAWVVGEALFGEDDYAAGLRRRAEELGVADRVRFLGFRADIAPLMKRCDVVVHTSTSPEPFGRVIVEGMLAGRPVVAADAGGAQELIEDRVTGRLTPPGDAGALGDAIRSLLADPGATRALADRGAAEARRHFSLDAVLPQWEMVLQHVVDRGGVAEGTLR